MGGSLPLCPQAPVVLLFSEVFFSSSEGFAEMPPNQASSPLFQCELPPSSLFQLPAYFLQLTDQNVNDFVHVYTYSIFYLSPACELHEG